MEKSWSTTYEERTSQSYTELCADLAEGVSILALLAVFWTCANASNCRETPLQLLTKGDNNAADDTELYAQGQNYLTRETDVIGSVIGYVPMVGYVTILLSEYPWLKTVMLGIMGLTVVLQRE